MNPIQTSFGVLISKSVNGDHSESSPHTRCTPCLRNEECTSPEKWSIINMLVENLLFTGLAILITILAYAYGRISAAKSLAAKEHLIRYQTVMWLILNGYLYSKLMPTGSIQIYPIFKEEDSDGNVYQETVKPEEKE
jgi:hypothetical protein